MDRPDVLLCYTGKAEQEGRRETVRPFFDGFREVDGMEAWLKIYTDDLDRMVDQLKERIGTEKARIALEHTLRDVGKKAKTLSKRAIQEQYEAKSYRIDKAFKRAIINTGSEISCIVPIVDSRGTIAKNGAFISLKRGPGAKVVKTAKTLLPSSKTSDRVHFYIPSGELAGHVFVRHKDGEHWNGYQWVKGKREQNKRRIGSISHGVAIAVPQMPMTRAAEGIQAEIADFAMQRLLHYEEQINAGVITK